MVDTQTESPKTLDDALRAIERADIVTFDVFDTLLARPLLRPTDVFVAVRDRLNSSGEAAVLANWPSQRMLAEQDCYRSPSVGPNVTLEQIYERMKEEFGYPQETCEIVMRVECETELKLLTATSRGRVLFDHALHLGKRIYILSDMYLPEPVISAALRDQGFDGWERMIVSGYAKMAKHDGSVFRFLKAEDSESSFLHIGDNPVSDVAQPLQYGFDAFELERQFVARRRSGGSALPLNMLNRITRAEDYSAATVSRSFAGGVSELWIEQQRHDIDPLDEIGYSVVGPMYVGLVQWVHDRAQRDGVTSLAFLARDGHVMQRAYQAYFGNSALPSEYIYASRRMMNFAVVSDRLTARDYDFLSATGTAMPIESFVTRFIPDIDPARLERAVAQTGLAMGSIIPAGRRVEVTVLLAALQNDIVDYARAEQEVVRDYLESLGFAEGGVGVVDIGWQGSIQASIESLLKRDVHGYYFGVLDTPKTQKRRTMHGWMDERNEGEEADWLRRLHGAGVELIELMFANPNEPSVLTVRRGADGYEAVHSSDRVRDQDRPIIARIQDAALRFVSDASAHSSIGSAASLPFDAALTFIQDLILHPSRKQAQLLGGLHHDNSLGVRSYPIGKPRRRKEFYSEHPRALARERENAWWKPGFEMNAARVRRQLGL